MIKRRGHHHTSRMCATIEEKSKTNKHLEYLNNKNLATKDNTQKDKKVVNTKKSKM